MALIFCQRYLPFRHLAGLLKGWRSYRVYWYLALLPLASTAPMISSLQICLEPQNLSTTYCMGVSILLEIKYVQCQSSEIGCPGRFRHLIFEGKICTLARASAELNAHNKPYPTLA